MNTGSGVLRISNVLWSSGSVRKHAHPTTERERARASKWHAKMVLLSVGCQVAMLHSLEKGEFFFGGEHTRHNI